MQRTHNTYQPKDNKTLHEKAGLRKQLLARLAREKKTPIAVIETHGGLGALYLRCYRNITRGVVFETDTGKADALARQRPTWQVCQTKAEFGLEHGIGSHLKIDLIDCDPYGAPWLCLKAFFESDRPFAQHLTLIAHDGRRQNLRRYGINPKAHDAELFEPFVASFGASGIAEHYLDICEALTERVASKAGYRLQNFGGFYSALDANQTHFWGSLQQ